VRFPRRKIEILAAALGIETQLHRNRFQQGGFARAILANEKSDGGMKFQTLQMPDRWNTKRIFLKAIDQFAFQPDRVQKGTLDDDVRGSGIWLLHLPILLPAVNAVITKSHFVRDVAFVPFGMGILE
jgi:hypothetical protein